MGKWSEALSKGEPDVAEILGSVPGEMCPKIDEWVRKERRTLSGCAIPVRPTKLGRRNEYDDLDALYSDADAIRDERDAAIDGLEECRTALEALRRALVDMTAAYREQRDCVARESA